MGYMGFGMRKEVYTRKPKRAFEKIKKAYEAEINKIDHKTNPTKHKKIDENLRQKIRSQIELERKKTITIRVVVSLMVILLFSYALYSWNTSFNKSHKQGKPNYLKGFKRVVITGSKNDSTVVDYYQSAGIASSVRYKNGLKHQNSESYYSTGEQFRSALYYHDTLIVEYYFYKNGDTIRNFPKIDPEKLIIVNLHPPKSNEKIILRVYDNKILLF